MRDLVTSRTVAVPMKSRTKETIQQPNKLEIEFSSIYKDYVKPIYRYIISRVGTHAEAEDLTSQVFMDALKAWSRFDKGGNIPAWLFTIARNKIVDRYRQQKPTIPLGNLDKTEAEDNDPLSYVLEAEMATRLSQIIGNLDSEQQELLQLRFAGELTYAQIGAVVGKTEAAVKMAVHRLLDRLQEQMEYENE